MEEISIFVRHAVFGPNHIINIFDEMNVEYNLVKCTRCNLLTNSTSHQEYNQTIGRMQLHIMNILLCILLWRYAIQIRVFCGDSPPIKLICMFTYSLVFPLWLLSYICLFTFSHVIGPDNGCWCINLSWLFFQHKIMYK